MKDLIKQILRENVHISDDAPDWVKEFHTLSREGRIAQIETNRKNILRLLPKIVNFFESKLGDDLEKIEITNDEEVRRRTYGNENYSTNAILIEFFFSQKTKTPARGNNPDFGNIADSSVASFEIFDYLYQFKSFF